MKRNYLRWQSGLLLGSLMVMLFTASASSAQQVIRITNFKAIPDKQEQVAKLIDEDATKMYAEMKGLEQVKFYYDPVSGERGSVTVWNSQADLDAFLESDARKATLEKLKPLIQGDVSSKVYQVYGPTGTQIGATTEARPSHMGQRTLAKQVLRILTVKAVPDKQEQAVKTQGEEIPKLFTGAKGLQWYKLYYDPSTGELGTVTIWNSQADVDTFMKSDARKAVVKKMRPLTQGDPSIKLYQVYEPKKYRY